MTTTITGSSKAPRRSYTLSVTFGLILTIAALLTAFIGLFVLSAERPASPTVLGLLGTNTLLVIILIILLVLMIRRVFYSRRPDKSAPKLHLRLLAIFSLAAIIPAIIVGAFFGNLLNRDLNNWFSENAAEAMTSSERVAAAYEQNESYYLGHEMILMASDLNRSSELLPQRISYTRYLKQQVQLRGIDAAYVIDSKGIILAEFAGEDAPEYIVPSPDAYTNADNAKTALASFSRIDYVRALRKLTSYEDAYLYIGREVNEGILGHLEALRRVAASYREAENTRSDLQRAFLITYAQAAMIVLLAALWMGLIAANRIVSPLGQIMTAADKVRTGDLSARVAEKSSWDEIGDLANAFNRMTSQLGAQTDELKREHDVSERRRIFSEAVLSGVSAGVIGLDESGKVTVINNSAMRMLGLDRPNERGQHISVVVPEFADVFEIAADSVERAVETHIEAETPEGALNFNVRVSGWRDEDQSEAGWVITFDDMTRLIAAQRHSAWREVARRIAHEIKNPLTPIQLSAERLERKYAPGLPAEDETFQNCTQTIMRQVTNLGRMVDEFSAFARMPQPEMEPMNISEVAENAMYAQRVAFPDLRFEFEPMSSEIPLIMGDARLIGQALTNILKNAAESVTTRMDREGIDDPDGWIRLRVHRKLDRVLIEISDNGLGWPLQDKARLMEPYMTTRETGTGLGLAIVMRILEDHGGKLELQERDDNSTGAIVLAELPIRHNLNQSPETKTSNSERAA